MPDPAETPPVDNAEIAKTLHTRIEASKHRRRQLHPIWQRNVAQRMGDSAAIYTGGLPYDEDSQAEINPDWSLTKTKTANLYSQVPTVQLTHRAAQTAPAVPLFAKVLNYEIGDSRTHIGVAMEEVLNDTVNAAGIGAIETGYAARFETKQVPLEETIAGPDGSPIPTKTLPPDVLQGLVASGQVHLHPVQTPTDARFFQSRISPSDLIVPADFTGSYFDDADFVGRTGRCSWPEAQLDFKLTDDERDAVTSETPTTEDDLRTDSDRTSLSLTRNVRFDRLYYWRYRVDPTEKSFSAIWKLVYVHGKTDPVIHEPWTGQRFDETTGTFVGSTHFPIQVLTLTYVTDHAIPPSDTAAGRPQVLDLRRSRSQMFLNRERSIPIRGFNTNRVDPLIQDNLLRGTYQGWIPFNGGGQDSIWEVARASYPAEDFAFDQAAKADLMESWQIGPNQTGQLQAKSKTSSAEAQITQANFATRIGQERGACARFFLRNCQVLAGLLVLYSDFPVLTDQERQTMQQAWDRGHLLHDLVFEVRPDSTVVLDVQAQLQRRMQALNMTAKSGFVNPKPIIAEILELSGIDPAAVLIDPQPKPPEEPTVSLRLSGKEDMANALVMAMLVHLKRAPSPEDLETAKKILAAVMQPPTATAVPGPSALPQPGGSPAAPPMSDARPEWGLMAKVAKRSRDLSPGG